MVSDALRTADRLVRKASIPDDERTQMRDAAADWIEENAADEWGEWTFTDVAEAADYSRQHITNVVEKYFEPVGDATNGEHDGELEDEGLDHLSARELEIYRRGYRDGWTDRGQQR